MFWLRNKYGHTVAANGSPCDPRLALLPTCSLVALETGKERGSQVSGVAIKAVTQQKTQRRG